MGSISEFSPTKMLAYVPAAMMENPKHVLELQGLSVSVCSPGLKGKSHEKDRDCPRILRQFPPAPLSCPLALLTGLPAPLTWRPAAPSGASPVLAWFPACSWLLPTTRAHSSYLLLQVVVGGCPASLTRLTETHEVRRLAHLGSHRPSPLPAALS